MSGIIDNSSTHKQAGAEFLFFWVHERSVESIQVGIIYATILGFRQWCVKLYRVHRVRSRKLISFRIRVLLDDLRASHSMYFK